MNLLELVAAARPGATLRLPAGRLTLAAPLVLDTPLTLKGAGPSKTVLVGSLICAAPRLRIEGLAVERRGKDPGHVVVAKSGRVEMIDVHLRGGRGRKGDDDMGAGLRLEGRSEAALVRCRIEKNAAAAVNSRDRSRVTAEEVECRGSLNGFEITGRAEAELKGCRCEDVENVGFAFLESSRGAVRGGTCRGGNNAAGVQGRARARVEGLRAEGCAYALLYAMEQGEAELVGNTLGPGRAHGVFVDGKARATVESNRIANAAVNGITVLENARVVARRNVVERCRQQGIWVEGRPEVELSENVCRGNTLSGIAIGGGKVVASRNTCESNAQYGLVACEEARPVFGENRARANKMGGLWVRAGAAPRVEGNAFEENEGPGIEIAEKARGSYAANRCAKNGASGILVADQAAPELLENRCEEHEDYGILYRDKSGGLAKGNVCARNTYGAGVLDEARPRLLRNAVTKNGGEGIKILDRARPSIEENVVEANGGGGIEYGDQAAGVARGNRCVRNMHGIECWGGVSPRLERNECVDNDGKGISQEEDRDGVKPKLVLVANVSRGNGDEDGIGPRLPAARLRKALAGTPAAGLVRPAWKPSTVEGEGLSKFGGVPRLDPGEPWPRCGGCGKPLPLLLQLDLSTLPKPFRAQGLLQAFCCRFDKDQCQDGEGYFLVRARSPKGVDARPAGKPWPARRIVGWRESGELPRRMESSLAKAVAARGLSYSNGDKDLGEGPDASAQGGDKLGGWAEWVQEADVPRCPRCRKDMATLFQIDSNDQLPFEWGDYGTAWIFRCDAHPEALGFGWQCL